MHYSDLFNCRIHHRKCVKIHLGQHELHGYLEIWTLLACYVFIVWPNSSLTLNTEIKVWMSPLLTSTHNCAEYEPVWTNQRILGFGNLLYRLESIRFSETHSVIILGCGVYDQVTGKSGNYANISRKTKCLAQCSQCSWSNKTQMYMMKVNYIWWPLFVDRFIVLHFCLCANKA